MAVNEMLPSFCQQIGNTIELADSMGGTITTLTFVSFILSYMVSHWTYEFSYRFISKRVMINIKKPPQNTPNQKNLNLIQPNSTFVITTSLFLIH